jgi:Fe-S oxidoreductase
MFDLNDPKFFDEGAIEAEMKRVFEICHGCRMCFNYCPSFPSLFDAIDAHEEKGEGEAEALTPLEMRKVVDLCYQCKLCYVKCPYTPPHKFDLDFPRLMLREKAARAKREGISLSDRFLGDPDMTMRPTTGVMAPLVNWVNGKKYLRVLSEKVTGIHRNRVLPPVARETFERWLKRTGRLRKDAPVDPATTVAVFETCSVNYNYPGIGVAAVQVLERNGKTVIRPPQRCCGMPAMDGGDLAKAAATAQANVEVLAPLVKAGVPLVVLGPTCGYTVKKEWPELLGTEDAKLVAGKAMDIGEYLAKEQAAGRLNTDFTVPQGRLAYHIPCHLRAQNIGTPFKPVLSKIPETQVETVERCSAFDGTWGMKKEYYDLSRQYAKKLVNDLDEAKADHLVSDCPLAGLNVIEGLGRAPAHPVEILRDAYGLKPEDAENPARKQLPPG